MSELHNVIQTLVTRDSAYYSPRITQIVDKYLGKGKKVFDATRDQAELVSLILDEIKEDLVEN